jgi:hypothetical protein
MPAIINAALYAGANGVALSGSGPGVLALCAGPTTAVAEAMQEAATRAGLTAHARVHDRRRGHDVSPKWSWLVIVRSGRVMRVAPATRRTGPIKETRAVR